RRRRAVQPRRSDGHALRSSACERRNRLRVCARARPREGSACGSVRCAVAEHGASRGRRAQRARPVAGAAAGTPGAHPRRNRGHQGRLLHPGARRQLMSAVAAGFDEPVLAAQSTFRNVMDAMARPGTVRRLAGIPTPAPLSPAAGAIALTLLDYETPFWLDAPLAAAPEVARWIAFHTRARLGRAAVATPFTLFDYEPPFWLDAPLAAAPEVARWIAFHRGARLTADPATAAFAFVADPAAAPPLESFAQGSLEYPDRSTS